MRIVFLGTPAFACPSLAALAEAGHEIPLVVSQPDKPRGRGRVPSPTPVRALARQLGLCECTLERGQRAAVYERILAARPQLVAVVAFGHLLREPLLSAAELGCVNVHASLLPRWRGAAPIHRALLAGDTVSGVTTMRVTAGLDEGPIYLARSTPIGEDETAGQLHDRLADLGARLLVETVVGLAAGSLVATSQPSEGVTWAPPLRKDEGTVEFDEPAQRVHDTVRALQDWPRVTVLHNGRRLALADSHVVPAGEAQPAGTVVRVAGDGLVIACRDLWVRIGRVQAEGGRWMDPATYARGHALRVGDRLLRLPREVTA